MDDILQEVMDRLARLLRSYGCTNFEINSRREAVEFLFTSMFLMTHRNECSKQLKYLLEHDLMTDEEWLLHIECVWNKFKLNDKIN